MSGNSDSDGYLGTCCKTSTNSEDVKKPAIFMYYKNWPACVLQCGGLVVGCMAFDQSTVIPLCSFTSTSQVISV